MNLLHEDIGYFDLTTIGLGIGACAGKMVFSAKSKIVVSGIDEVVKILKECDLKYTLFKQDGDDVTQNEIILECEGFASSLHKAWKISQNLLEYMSGIATYTHLLVTLAKDINPHIVISTTRKNFPSAKELMLKAVMAGGGVPHRLGTYDSILVFKQHLIFLGDKAKIQERFAVLKHKFLEKKITVEVDNFEDAYYFASIGADMLQCEKMDIKTLSSCVALKKEFPNLLISSTGGVNESNIQNFVKIGVDFIVTSAPYHAKPVDIRVDMSVIE
jgi:molybdenum transport protein